MKTEKAGGAETSGEDSKKGFQYNYDPDYGDDGGDVDDDDDHDHDQDGDMMKMVMMLLLMMVVAMMGDDDERKRTSLSWGHMRSGLRTRAGRQDNPSGVDASRFVA